MFAQIRRRITPFSIDVLNREYSTGWCFSRLAKGRPVEIVFRIDGRVAGRARCELPRPDLVTQKLHPTGLAGFECRLEGLEDIGPSDRLSVHAGESSVPLLVLTGERVPAVFHPVEKPLFFMHIPKTAGTAFNNTMRQYFGQGRSHVHIQARPLDEQQRLAGQSDFLSGHITLEHVPTIYQGASVDLHAIVRQPARQLHSHLGWVKGIAVDPTGGVFREERQHVREMGLGLIDADLSRPKNLAMIAANLDGFQVDYFDNIQTRYFLDYRPDRVTESDLENAIANLGRFNTVGLTESLGEYVSAFCDHYGIRQKPETSVHNPAKVRPLFDSSDPAVLKAIEPMIVHDRKLYDVIQARAGVRNPA